MVGEIFNPTTKSYELKRPERRRKATINTYPLSNRQLDPAQPSARGQQQNPAPHLGSETDSKGGGKKQSTQTLVVGGKDAWTRKNPGSHRGERFERHSVLRN